MEKLMVTKEDLERRLSELEKKVSRIESSPAFPNRLCYTYRELAEAAGCSVAKIRRDEKMGLIRVRYPNARKRFHPEDVDWYLRGEVRKKGGAKCAKKKASKK